MWTAEKEVGERKVKNLNIMTHDWTRKIHDHKCNRDVSLTNSLIYLRMYLMKYTKQWINRGAGSGMRCWGRVWIQPINFSVCKGLLPTTMATERVAGEGMPCWSSEKMNHMGFMYITPCVCTYPPTAGRGKQRADLYPPPFLSVPSLWKGESLADLVWGHDRGIARVFRTFTTRGNIIVTPHFEAHIQFPRFSEKNTSARESQTEFSWLKNMNMRAQ